MSNIFKLKSAVWEITLDCCFSCKYCGSGGGKKRDAELSTDECIRVCIITNGFLFHQSGSFCRAVEAINRLAKEGIIVSVISTLNRESADMLEDFLDILQTLPIAAWQIQACSPMGDAARFGIDYRFVPGDIMY